MTSKKYEIFLVKVRAIGDRSWRLMALTEGGVSATFST